MARIHSWTNVAPCLKTLLGQFNADYPQRKMTNAGTDADGIWPSKLHSQLSPNSDHESGNALDIDDDLSGFDGKPPQVTPEMARLISEDLRCKYAIHDSVIYHGGAGKPYAGSNKHTGHLHISVNESMRNDARKWDIGQEDAVSYRFVHGYTIGADADGYANSIRDQAAALGMAATADANTFDFHGPLDKVKKLEAVIDANPARYRRRHGMPVGKGTHERMGVSGSKWVGPAHLLTVMESGLGVFKAALVKFIEGWK